MSHVAEGEMLPPNQFRCAMCHHLYEKVRPEREAKAECLKLYGPVKDSEIVPVCDLCYHQMESAFPWNADVKRPHAAPNRPRSAAMAEQHPQDAAAVPPVVAAGTAGGTTSPGKRAGYRSRSMHG